ncbi:MULTISPECIES: GNAT family N-acetyltransferase [unclassified Frigoribacterium]|uniref:GNAT family N-acetyltransferase n=1 Tax=unclassified Frigoribacterium TaxID=2627005 RepID=UPI001564B18F|nr:GNAT family N-acetyltransferase [Frigoribacterium sp. VKM Ac-2860]NQX08026.1 GNAT family N-acetyltransferase [Frigoribacterium sp. VKM Ac-2859]
MTPTQHSSSVAEIDPVVLYEILRLRVDVFVVEQECPYPELDGRDLEPTARLLWSTDDDARILATLRVLHDGDDRRIGRVATASSARGRGLAADLMRSAVDECDGRLVRLDAQAHLSGWYARFGFVVDGDEFLEDGIPHLPMTLAATR